MTFECYLCKKNKPINECNHSGVGTYCYDCSQNFTFKLPKTYCERCQVVLYRTYWTQHVKTKKHQSIKDKIYNVYGNIWSDKLFQLKNATINLEILPEEKVDILLDY